MTSSCFASAALLIDSSAVLVTHYLTRCSSFPNFLIRPLSQKRHLSAGNSLDGVEAEYCDTLRLFTELSPNSELVFNACFLRFIVLDTFVKRWYSLFSLSCDCLTSADAWIFWKLVSAITVILLSLTFANWMKHPWTFFFLFCFVEFRLSIFKASSPCFLSSFSIRTFGSSKTPEITKYQRT